MKYLLLILPFLVACNSTEDIINNGYIGLCNRQPESMSCIKHESVGITPSFQTVIGTYYEALENYTYNTDREQYGVDEYWFDNETTSKELTGDCEDVSITFISQLILDGVNPKNIRLVASGINGTLKHYYARVELYDGTYFDFNRIDEYEDLMYMQYDNIGVFIR